MNSAGASFAPERWIASASVIWSPSGVSQSSGAFRKAHWYSLASEEFTPWKVSKVPSAHTPHSIA